MFCSDSGSQLPIIFLTTRSPSEEPRLLEANDFVKKPSNENEIMSKIKNMIYLKKLNDVQTRFVPREFLDLLGCTTLTDIHLGNHVQKFMSVLFCDIRGFTALSETLTGAETFDFINQFLAIGMVTLCDSHFVFSGADRQKASRIYRQISGG